MLKKKMAICKSGDELAIFNRVRYRYRGLFHCSVLCKHCVTKDCVCVICCQGLEYAMCKYVNRNDAPHQYLNNYSYVV